MPEEFPKKIPAPNYDSFASQYTNKVNCDINGAQVESVYIRPENSKTEVPVLVLPGWGATMESFKPGMKVLTERGRPVRSLNFPREGGNIPYSHNEEVEEWYKKRGKKYPKWPSTFLRQANIDLGLLEQKYIAKVDVIAHSMAGPGIIAAAMICPEKFMGRTIILINSSGLIGKDSIFRLKKGADENTKSKGRPQTTLDILDKDGNIIMPGIPVTEEEEKYLESTKHITPDYLKANLPRALKEIWDISQFQITEDMLRYLKEKGIKVIIVGAVEDTMFPMGTISEQREVLGLNERKRFVGNKGMQKNVEGDAVAGFVSTRGGHMQIQVNSKEFMSALETMLPPPEGKKG